MMMHGIPLHRKAFGNAVEKRVPQPTPAPEPEPQLLGDIIGGVGSIAGEAIDGVVGLVTTVLSDVNALLSPARASPAPVPGPPTSAPSNPQPTGTPASPNPVSTPSSGGSNSGGDNSEGSNTGANSDPASSGQIPDGPATNTNGNLASTPNPLSGPSRKADSDGRVILSDNDSRATETPSVSEEVGGVDALVQVTEPTREVSPAVALPSSSASGAVVGIESTTRPRITAVPVVNAVSSIDGADTLTSTAPSGARSTGITRSTLHSPSSTDSASPGPDPGGNGGASDHGASSASLSPGIVAAIVIGATLALIALVIFVVRRWHRKRRERRFTTWMSRPGPFTFLGAASVNVNKEKNEKSDGSGSGVRSARSSFGTTFDQGLSPFAAEPFQPSTTSFSFYSMANTSSIQIQIPSPSVSIAAHSLQRLENSVSRHSLNSLESSSSHSRGAGETSGREVNTSTEAVAADEDNSTNGHGQYLFLSSAQSQNPPYEPQASPISVRPWSPSERWAFPVPPPAPASAANSIFYQPPTFQTIQAERVPASQFPPLPPVTSHEATDPFADPSRVSTDVRRESSVSVATEGAVTAKTSASASETDGVVGAVERIRRPFDPTLADELAVKRGDIIRVLQVFDDGWVHVEKLSSANGVDQQPSGSVLSNLRGLIPIDCLRESGEPLPSFLASRRVSSYYGQGLAI